MKDYTQMFICGELDFAERFASIDKIENRIKKIKLNQIKSQNKQKENLLRFLK